METHATLPHRREVEPSQVGAADGEARRRRHIGQTRAECCAPRLLLGQEQQGKETGRTPRNDTDRVAHPRIDPSQTAKAKPCRVCGHGKMIHLPARHAADASSGGRGKCNAPLCNCERYEPAA